MPRTKRPPPELFRFAVENWEVGYGLHLNHKVHDILGLCWQHHDLLLGGGVRNKTKRKIERVNLRLEPRDFDPKDWKPDWKAIGVITGVQRRTIEASIKIPTVAFQSLLTATAAGKVRGIDISIDEFERSSGRIMSFMIIDDPDEPLDGYPSTTRPQDRQA